MKTKPPIALIAALICLPLASCKKDAGGGNGPAKPPAPTHESIAREAIDLNAEFVEILANASDKASAEAAVEKVSDVAGRFEAIAARMEAIGLPEGELKTKIADMFKAQQDSLNQKVNALMGTLLGDKEVGGIIVPAMNAFEERMNKLTVIDTWSGGDGTGE